MPTTILRSGNFIRPDAVLREAGIREGMRVVHFGCGPGFYAIPAAQFVGPEGRVVAIDIRVPALEEVGHRARLENLQNIDVMRADLTVPGGSQLPDGWADLVLLANILHQSDPRQVVAEAARVLRPAEGRVLMIEWELVNVPLGPPVEQRVAPDILLAAARLAGLALLRQWKPSPYHYALLFTRSGESI
jgi:ubiquinone/menaquinone biosynthesis C-methylase UbiE